MGQFRREHFVFQFGGETVPPHEMFLRIFWYFLLLAFAAFGWW